MTVRVVGAGVAGLVTAVELAERGVAVELVERGTQLGDGACSWIAGGMLAPWCEAERAEPPVTALGRAALEWWPRHYPGTRRDGTLVVAPPRDTPELARFARRTDNFERVDGARIAALEPDLAGRFRTGLFFREEGHLDPRQALRALADRLAALGHAPRFGTAAEPEDAAADWTVDCRGLAARGRLPELRAVRGEMLVLRCPEVSLSRPVRLLHPRIPLYVVPRGGGHYMIGATMIESEARGGITVRSAVELLNAAVALHPAFAEAEIVETGADLRPAFPDNLPRLVRRGRTLHLNGFFRHGFLLAPAFARQVADIILQDKETRDESDRERQEA